METRSSKRRKCIHSLSPSANSPLGVMYVEVNDSNFVNAGCYSLVNGAPTFDIAIIFASNINYDVAQQRAVLHHNDNVRIVLGDVETYIRPLQARGIKVLLSILGNHQGAGVCNFTTVAAANNFALQLAGAVNQYGLDGIDFDDEYSDYGQNGLPQPNAFSFIYLLRELRALIPDKIISFYFYGPAASRLSYDGLIAGTYLDYSWNAIYGTFQRPNVPGLENHQLGPAAVNVQSTSAGTAQTLATRTVNEGYGIYLYYNLPNNNIESYISGVTTRLYNGVGTVVPGGCLRGWPPREKQEDCCGDGCACSKKTTHSKRIRSRL